MQIQLKVRGLEELMRALDPEKLKPYLVKAGEKATTLVRDRLRQYPPARRSSRRTGRLRRGWKAQVSASGQTARVVNRERYAHIVQGGASTRPWYSEVGWLQATDVVRESTLVGQVVRAYDDEIEAYVKEIG